MNQNYSLKLLCVYAVLVLLLMCGVNASGQQQNQNPPEKEQRDQDTDDVIRISTELVQTAVSVVDKKGKFVEGLRIEDFELKVDGKPVEVGFLERASAGSSRERAQRAPTGDTGATLKNQVKEAAVEANRSRAIVFFVDDIHLAIDSLKLAKDTIIKFIDTEMGPNDLVAITSSSGQVGFLQQYTDNKDVLKMAVSRISYRGFGTRDGEAPVMTDGAAVLINQGDAAVTAYFVRETIRMQYVPPSRARDIVRMRARILGEQVAGVNKATLSALETLARRAKVMPGRKLIFFFSDGFPIDHRNSDTPERLRRIADAAMRSGVMVYTLDARGLVTDMMDATVENPPTGVAAIALRSAGEDVLNALAEETGGRFIHNTNWLSPEVTKALTETSNYYLLAWRPNEVRSGKEFHRVKVAVKNRPDLSVRAQRGYFENTPEEERKDAQIAKATAPVDPLRKAINSLVPKRAVPTRLVLTYMETPGAGSTLLASMKVETSWLKVEQHGDKTAAVVEIAGIVFDANGKTMDNFSHRLTVTPPLTGDAKLPEIVYNHRAKLKPGLYQVRVAARDRASGQTGSAAEWIKIPDLSKQGFSMSSLILGERKPSALDATKKADEVVEGITVSVDRRFERASNLRYLVYIYNAAHREAAANAHADVTLQAQIFREDQLVATMPPRQPSTESEDPSHLVYAAEIPLEELRAGQYTLQVTATDRITKASASQRVRFEVQ